MNEIFMLFLTAGAFLAVIFIAYQLMKTPEKENEIFARNHVEDAMRIKARQYENGIERH